MPEFKDIIYYIISLLGILITGLFSFLVWRATKKSSEATIASYRLSESIINANKKIHERLRKQYLLHLAKNVAEVMRILEIQKKSSNLVVIDQIPRNSGLNNKEVAEFLPDKMEDVSKLWSLLNDYLNVYWIRNGKFITGIDYGNAQLKERIHKESTDLYNNFEKLYQDILLILEQF